MKAPSAVDGLFRRLVGRSGLVLAFVWGLAEGSLFFLVPDILFTLTALRAPVAALRQVGAVTIGSLLAGAILYAAASANPNDMQTTMEAVPFVTSSMVEQANVYYQESGVWAPCRGPLSGIPYKVFAVLAPEYVSPVPFLVVSIPARLERLLISWALFVFFGFAGQKIWAKWPRCLVGFHLLYWIATYAWYWTTQT